MVQVQTWNQLPAHVKHNEIDDKFVIHIHDGTLH